jgi:hypothetical protein
MNYLTLRASSTGSLTVGSLAKTTASGDSSLVLKSCEIAYWAAELVVTIEDANVKRLATSNPVEPKAASPGPMWL